MSYKKDFIKFMCDAGVLTFGEFTLKSGRKAPYFINTGNYKTGEHIAKLGEFYAQCLAENGIDSDVLYGPAYKGPDNVPQNTKRTAGLLLMQRSCDSWS